MKIDKITICNLNSLEGEHTIDFSQEPLRSAGLYAITGDTGSGKTTLLDAICLALYADAPRFDDAQKISKELLEQIEDKDMRLQAGDPRNMLRRGKKEGYAIVEFSTQDGKRYEAGWHIRKRRTGTFDRATRTLRCLSPKKESFNEKEIPAQIEQIIGLDYTQFSRTVLLAQNSFANFLKAKRDAKSMLLERLTGTEIYGVISEKIFRLTAQAKERTEAIENQITGILRDKLETEDVEEKVRQCDFLETAIERNKEQAELLQQQLKWVEENAAAEENVKQCEAAYHKAHKENVAAHPDAVRIERYDSVLDIQPTYQAIVTCRTDIEALKAREAEIANNIIYSKKRAESIVAELKNAREALHQAETNLAHRRPAINRGHSLKGQIKESEAQLLKVEEELKESQIIVQGRKSHQEAKQEELKSTQTKIEQLQMHKQELFVHKQMFDKFDLVKDKLGLYQSEAQRNAELHQKANNLQSRQTKLAEATQALERTQQEQQTQLDSYRSELNVHQSANNGIDSEYIQRRLTESQNRLVRLERASALWKRISGGYEAIHEKQSEISRINAEQNQLVDTIAELEKEKQVAAEVCQNLTVALTLSQSENIVQLRKQLKEGTACPVCGATHHPYHTETERELGELLENLDKNYIEAKEKLEAKSKILDDLRKQYAENAGRLQAEERALVALQTQQETYVAEWSTCADLDPVFDECSPTVNRNARQLMIDMHIDNAQKAADEAETELKAFNYHQQATNRLNQEIDTLIQQMDADRNQWQSMKTEQHVVTTSLDEIGQTLYISDRACQGYYQDLDELITIIGWFDQWKENPDGFKMHLVQMQQDWAQTCRDLENTQTSEARLIEEVKAATASYDESVRLYRRSEDGYRAMEEDLYRKREEMQMLFGGKSPEQEEETLQNQVDTARATVEVQQKEHDAAESEINMLRGGQLRANEERQLKKNQLSAKQSELDLWLLRFNRDHSPMLTEELDDIFSDRTDWKKLRGELEEKKNALHLAELHLDAARRALLELQTKNYRPKREDEMSTEYLTTELGNTQAEIKHQTNELTELRIVLNKHHNCIKDADKLMADTAHLRDDYEHWRSLCALLGSSDGKKFRELAQSYTFGFLVNQANYHLRQLSPRYELRTQPGTLNLTVIDRDMFDEERHIQSLSGGETFVASLALALGLASLSSGQTLIGSLFIDEGFGNLDQASLQLVMDALSRLETTQGRKVGLVSHTHQIREQIHPQIRVIKHPSGGKSYVEVR